MFSLHVRSGAFAGLPLVKQHMLVKAVIGEDIARWHGFVLKTATP